MDGEVVAAGIVALAAVVAAAFACCLHPEGLKGLFDWLAEGGVGEMGDAVSNFFDQG